MSVDKQPKPSVFLRPFLWLGSRPAALWSRMRPERRTLAAISWMSFLATCALGGYLGWDQRISADLLVFFGYAGEPLMGDEQFWFDLGAGVGISILLVPAITLVLALIMRLGRWLPTATGRLGLGALIAMAFFFCSSGFSPGEGLVFAIITVFVIALVFGSLACLTGSGWKTKTAFGKTVAWLSILLGFGAVAAIGYAAVHEGTLDHLTEIPAYSTEFVAAGLSAEENNLDDPGAPGAYAAKIGKLSYGSGSDRRRPEFGAEAALKTETVNGRAFAKLPKGHKGKVRELFWQFKLDEMPINGRVWYPIGEGKFPLVLVVHGNHDMTEFSDPGYEYLGEHLASHGYILCSVDQNFINGNLRQENDARGWLLLQHLKVWQGWNQTAGNPFFAKVDMDKIALMGHSRGGEAVVHAALFNRLSRYPDDASVKFDFGFSIKSIVSIAPVDGQYKPAGRRARLRDLNYLTLHGSHDADVTRFHGDRIYNRVSFSPESDCFKTSLYIYRANHGQFNTVWGATDTGAPRSLFLNRHALLKGEDQRQIAKVFITAFLEASLRGKRGYLPLFSNPRHGADWLPDAALVSRYEDASFRLIADYEEDVDVTTTSIPGGEIVSSGLTVFREGDIAMRGKGVRDNQGVYLGWNTEPDESDDPDPSAEVGYVEASASKVNAAEVTAQPYYEIVLPEGFMAKYASLGGEQIVMHLAEVDEKPKAKDYSRDANEEEGENAKTEESDAEDSDEEDSDEAAEDKLVRDALDCSVVLVSEKATVSLPLSRYGRILPPLKVETYRTSRIGRKRSKIEIAPQVFMLPLADFQSAEPSLDLTAVTSIRLVFDRAPKGVLVIDRIGVAGALR